MQDYVAYLCNISTFFTQASLLVATWDGYAITMHFISKSSENYNNLLESTHVPLTSTQI